MKIENFHRCCIHLFDSNDPSNNSHVALSYQIHLIDNRTGQKRSAFCYSTMNNILLMDGHFSFTLVYRGPATIIRGPLQGRKIGYFPRVITSQPPCRPTHDSCFSGGQHCVFFFSCYFQQHRSHQDKIETANRDKFPTLNILFQGFC